MSETTEIRPESGKPSILSAVAVGCVVCVLAAGLLGTLLFNLLCAGLIPLARQLDVGHSAPFSLALAGSRLPFPLVGGYLAGRRVPARALRAGAYVASVLFLLYVLVGSSPHPAIPVLASHATTLMVPAAALAGAWAARSQAPA